MRNEVFLITVNEDLEDVATEVFIFKQLETCNFKLSDISWGNLDDDNIRVYHGILVTANFIPENFKGCTPYIMIKNPEGDVYPELANEHMFKKITANSSTVATTIQTLLDDDDLFAYGNYTHQLVPTIEDVQLFFGQKYSPIFQIAEETIDEEIIDRLSNLLLEFNYEKNYNEESNNEK